MPEKITNIANTTISIIYVAGGLLALFSLIGGIASSYAIFVIRTFNKKFKEIKESLKKDDDKMDKILEKVSSNAERIAKIEGGCGSD